MDRTRIAAASDFGVRQVPQLLEPGRDVDQGPPARFDGAELALAN
jgi:hypothetical protein